MCDFIALTNSVNSKAQVSIYHATPLNETVQDVEGAHVDLYHALVAHYVVCWEQEDVWWPKTAVRLRGKVDRREREAGGGRCARDADEERHAFISDVDNGDEGSGSDQDY